MISIYKIQNVIKTHLIIKYSKSNTLIKNNAAVLHDLKYNMSFESLYAHRKKITPMIKFHD